MLVHLLLQGLEPTGNLGRVHGLVIRDLLGNLARLALPSLAGLALVGGGLRTGALQDVGDRPGNGLGHDAVQLVVFNLLLTAPVGLVDGGLHRAGHAVGVQDGLAAQVASGAADGLDQRAGRTQEAFLVRIQNRHQRDLGHVQALAQQVDAHQHVELAQAQVTDDLHALNGVDVRMQVTHADAVLAQVLGKVLRHPLGQRRHQHAVT
jgi:hypothetical protein